MSCSLSSLWGWFKNNPQFRIIMMGMDDVGKTSLLYHLKLGKAVQPTSTIGFNVETLAYRDVSFFVWDMGGADKLRALQRSTLHGDYQAIIWVVDSTDEDRFRFAREELEDLVSRAHCDANCKLLIFNNKTDLPTSMSSSVVAEKLGFPEKHNREVRFFSANLINLFWWAIQSCSAKTGEGLQEGLEKLYLSLTGQKPMNGEVD